MQNLDRLIDGINIVRNNKEIRFTYWMRNLYFPIVRQTRKIMPAND